MRQFFYALIACFAYLPLINTASNKVIYLVPFAATELNDQLFNMPGTLWHTWREACRARGYELTTSVHKYPQHAYALVIFNKPNSSLAWSLLNHPAPVKKIIYLWEPPSSLPGNYDQQVLKKFTIIMTWHDGLVDNKRFRKFFLPCYLGIPQPIPFAQKKMCTMMANNKRSTHPDELYSARCEAIRFFEQHDLQQFDLYGNGWRSVCYKGYVDDKIATLRSYKFCICYENMKNIPGYISEKILDCFSAGCVPVYWGASNIENYIPANCFIDRRTFTSLRDLYAFLCNMPQETYETYMSNIENFVNSTQAQVFSACAFIDTFLELLD